MNRDARRGKSSPEIGHEIAINLDHVESLEALQKMCRQSAAPRTYLDCLLARGGQTGARDALKHAFIV